MARFRHPEQQSTAAAAEVVEVTVLGPVPVPPPVPAPRPHTRRRLGEVLVGQGLLTEAQLAEVLTAQHYTAPGEHRLRLGPLVVDRGLVSERDLVHALAEALDLDLVDLSRTAIDPEIARLLPRTVAERHGVLLMTRTARGGLAVAMGDPTDVVALDDIRLYTGAAEVVVSVASDSQVRDHLRRAWALTEDSAGEHLAAMLSGLDGFGDGDAHGLERSDVSDAPIVKLVNELFAEAVRVGASDIHVEPQREDLRVRFRVDGLLREVMSVPKGATAAVASRIKVMSGLDIAERRRPQDGRARLQVDDLLIDARISTLPTVHGEKVVIRLLSRDDTVPELSGLGFTDRQLEGLIAGLLAPQGLVLITGPTGSGKTNTLYSAIQHVRSAARNIVTLEDPVEISLAGINQVQVSERAGMTFARGLRAVLRQDPDIVLVGEVRDLETADLALQASLTGHLVLTTLLTNAVGAVTRLVDMGCEPFLVASSLTMVVAQRLVRRPCRSCAAPYQPSPRTLELLGLGPGDLAAATPRAGTGCPDCGGTGYRGRTGVFEILPITAAVRRVLLSTPTEQGLRAAARSAAMLPLRASGLLLAARGGTTYEEVLRVTHVDASDGRACRVCERSVTEDMVVCPWCATAVDRGHCTSCSRPLDPEWRICPWCRTTAPAPDEPVDIADQGQGVDTSDPPADRLG
jgi:type IV pilus assembly protein PilB